MHGNKRILCLIPARGGSKGLPGKNIRPFFGKPLISWTVEQALASRYIDRVVVSTDDAQIAEISAAAGAELPFIRPKELADDQAKTIDVIFHAIDNLSECFDYLILLEPTSPLREVGDIENSIERLVGHPIAKSLVSVAKLEGAHPAFNVIIDSKTGYIRKLGGGAKFGSSRRQDLTDMYFFDGTLYLSEVKMLMNKKTFFHELTLGYPVPRWKALEIDELCDFICGEALKKARIEGLI